MQVHRAAAFLAMSLLATSAENCRGGASFAVQYSSRLNVSSRIQLEQRIRAPFAEGTAHPPGVSNCTQLLARRGAMHNGQDSDRELQAMRSTFAECLVLHELQSAVPAHRSYVRDLTWDEHVLPFLPPELAISVSDDAKRAISRASAQGKKWIDFDPSLTARTKRTDEIVITGSGLTQQLILWGRGDFNGDGNDDLLVQSLDTLTEGSYRNTRLFVLTRQTAKGPLSLVQSLL